MRIFSAMSAARSAFAKAMKASPAAKQSGAVSNHTYNTPHASYGSGTRTTATYMPMGELREARSMDRREAIKSSRFLRNRLGLVKALFENSARHAVGSGISPSTDSGDKEYDKRSDDLFEGVAGRRTFDVREEHNVYTMQPMLLADMMCDGDLGAAKVRDENFDPRVQLFPTEAIGDAPGNGEKGWKDGILRDLTGRKLRFRVLKDVRPGDVSARRYFDYSADEFMHVARFDRININRPMPWLSHGKESCLDILDTTALEKVTRKLNSYIAAAITTPTGETPVGFEETLLNEQQHQLPSEDKQGNKTTKKTTRVYADFLGGAAIPVLQDGEKFEFFQNSRTSLTATDFIDWLITDIAAGFGVPKVFVWSVLGASGPNTRMILQQTDWFFRHLQEILISTFLQPVWEGIIEDALNRNKLKLPKAGANWRNVLWQGPQPMSIDKGRDGQLFETLVRSGMLSRSEWHEMSGKAGRAQRFKIMDEIAEDIAYCQSKNIPLELYFGTHPGQLVGQGGNSNDPESIAQAVVKLMAEQQ